MATQTFVSADAHGMLLSISLIFATLGFLSDSQRWAAVLPGALVTILGPFALATVGVLPHDAPFYRAVFAYLLPISLPLLLFEADLARIRREIGRTGLAFLVVVFSTCASLGLLLPVFGFGASATTVASAQAAGLIGGSVNVLATLDILGVPPESTVRVATLAAFLVGATTFMFVLFALANVGILERWLARAAPVACATQGRTNGGAVGSAPLTMLRLAVLVGIAAAVVIAADGIVFATERGLSLAGFAVEGLRRYRLLVITALALALASAGRRARTALAGAFPVGTYLMYVYLSVIGPFANLGLVLDKAPLQLVYVLCACVVQAALALSIARLLGLRFSELLVAMMACVTSQGAAVSVAVARGWRDLVTPAVLAGLLGYASASFIAALFARVLSMF